LRILRTSQVEDNVTTLRPVEKKVNQRAVALLKTWLAQAESGELLTVNLQGCVVGGRWQTAGSAEENRLESAAMLLELAIRKLGFVTMLPIKG
jgi:hypothetical protein